MQIHIYYNRHTDTGTHTRVNGESILSLVLSLQCKMLYSLSLRELCRRDYRLRGQTCLRPVPTHHSAWPADLPHIFLHRPPASIPFHRHQDNCLHVSKQWTNLQAANLRTHCRRRHPQFMVDVWLRSPVIYMHTATVICRWESRKSAAVKFCQMKYVSYSFISLVHQKQCKNSLVQYCL